MWLCKLSFRHTQEDQWDLLLWDSAQGLAAIITAFEQNSCQSQWGGKQNIVHPESPFSAIVITMSNIFFLFGKMPCSLDETDTAAAMFVSIGAAIVYNLEALFPALSCAFQGNFTLSPLSIYNKEAGS